MRRQPTSPLVALLLAVLLALLALVAVRLLLPRAAAAELPGRPDWQPCPAGPTLASPATWCAEGVPAEPAVLVEGGAGGLANCVDDGSAVTLRCVIWAQGDWARITADGLLVAERHRLGLSLLGGPPSQPGATVVALLSEARLTLIDSTLTDADDWTPARAAAATAAVEAARAWWAQRLGEPAPAPLPTPALRPVDNPYIPALWMPPADGTLQIYVVAHRPGADLGLVGGHSGLAWPGRIVALEQPRYGPLAPLVAHEIGHAVYRLPDLDSDATDIMARGYQIAYRRGVVGCTSLAALGRPCQRVGLPLLARSP